MREMSTGITLGIILAVIGFFRIELWQLMHDQGWTALGMQLGHDYGANGLNPHLVALTVALSLVGVVMFGTLAGSMLPFVMRRSGSIPRAPRRRSSRRSWTWRD